MEAVAQPRCRRTLIIALVLLGLVVTTQGGCQIAATGQNAQGVRHFQSGQYTAAMHEFQKAITSDPKNPDGYYNLARVTHKMGIDSKDTSLTDQAEALYNQCLDHDPNHVDCHRSLAVLLTETGRPEKAFGLLKNWAAGNPQIADARIELARMYEEFGDPQAAKKHLEDAVQQDPNNPRAWLALAQLREASGDLNQALANYQRSYSLNSMQPAVQQRIASLTQQLTQNYDKTLSGGGTRMANPSGTNNLSRGRY